MSDNQTELDTSDDAEFVMEDPVAEVVAKKRNGVAWFALLLAALAFGTVAYTTTAQWLNTDAASDLDTVGKIGAMERGLRDNDAAITAVESQISNISYPDFSADIAAVKRDVDGQLGLMASLPARMSTLENSVASLAGISAGARETFLLAEAEYYLQIANAQLQLANNPHLAMLALGMADERVTQLSDPGLTAVRRAISDELANLEVMEKPDLEGATLTLASLARVVESLPIASDRSEESANGVDDAEQGGVDKAWSSVKDAMSGLVKVTPPDEAKLTLISPDAEYFLRNNIALQLQSARLALLRGEQSIFEQSLDDATAVLTTYFDNGSEQVAGAVQTIAEIRAGVFTIDAPDISDSLRQLRQFRTLRETRE